LNGYYGVAFNPQGTVLAYANLSNIVLLDLSDLKSQTILKGQPSSMMFDLAFSPDGNTLASTSTSGNLILWNLDSDHRLQHLIENKVSDWVQTINFIPSTQSFAVGWDNNSMVDLWDITSGKQIGQFVSGRSGGIKSLAISSDGQLLATGGSDQNVLLWDLPQKKLLNPPLSGHTSLVMGLAFSPNGQYLVSSALGDESIRLWDVLKQKLVTTFSASDFSNNDIMRIAFSPDGKSFATCGVSGNIVVWDVATKRKRVIPFTVSTSTLGGCTTLEYSPDGSKIALNDISSGSVIVIEISTGDIIANLNMRESSGMASGFSFSPDGTRLAAAFCTDFFTGCQHGTIAFWDMSNFQSLGQFPVGFMQSTNALVFSPDNKILITGGKSGQIIAWDVSVRSWLYRACQIANRNLSISEWEQYIGSQSPYNLTCPELPAGEGVLASNISNPTPSVRDETPPPLFQLLPFSPPVTTVDNRPVIGQNNTVTPQGGWRVQVGTLPDSFQYEFPAIIQCRASVDSDNYVQQFLGIWALKNTLTDQWVYNGEAHVTLLDASGNEITRYPLSFSSGNNTIDWLMPDDNQNSKALINNISPETVLRLEIDNIEWRPTSDKIGDYKADISVQSHSLYGNSQYPQHMVEFAVDNLGKYAMKNVGVFAVVQNSEGEIVDLIRSGDSMDLGSGEGGYFNAKSISQSGRCVGKGDEKGYILHYWVSFITEDGKQIAEFYGTSNLR